MGGGCRNLASVEDDDELETPVLRPLVWMGNAKRNIQAFPRGAQKSIGDELQLIQFGGMPKDAKPFKVRVITIIDRRPIGVSDVNSSIWHVLGVPVASSPVWLCAKYTRLVLAMRPPGRYSPAFDPGNVAAKATAQIDRSPMQRQLVAAAQSSSWLPWLRQPWQ